MEKTTEPWAKWEPCPNAIALEALARIRAEVPQYFEGTTLTGARRAALPFYRVHRLLALDLAWQGKTERVFLLDGNGRTHWLSGFSAPMHDANEIEELELDAAAAADYLRYFLYFLRADEGAFVLVESPAEIVAIGRDDAWVEQGPDKVDLEAAGLWTRLQNARTRVAPLQSKGVDEDGRFLFEASIVYGAQRAQAVFAVKPNGNTEMVDDEPLLLMDGIAGPDCPVLDMARKTEPVEEPEVEDELEPEPEEPEPADEAAGPSRDRQVVIREVLVARTPETGRDRQVTEAVVATLLEEAVRERDGNQLLRHFNSETAADKPIERLASLVLGSVPIVVIESDIPFVEDFVIGLLAAANPEVTKGIISRASAVSSDDGRCEIEYRNAATRVHLLSFHAYRTLWDAERAAHELAIRDAAVLVGADRLSDVPEPLRRVTDLVLKFPRIDRKLFARIFERVFGTKPSQGWEGTEADWTRYLVPADFHAPRRLALEPDTALAFLKERVANRLRLVSAETGPRLADLHGMGEARQVAEDLISDVRAAQTGQLAWSSVDRGLLLVGRPGTGKTTLARAIARECGVKFIVASAAGWQAAGFLDAHLRAMRADFTEARRFAPAMLFIDEIDSIGNRETLSGPVVQYQTEVINALLEQIQGFDTGAPVIVIGATNYIEKVDPALRRAGRLDQVVQIPLPNIPSLEEIFRYYLKPYRALKEVGDDVQERPLAELAFGLTGADVEFFVRGASRRARRDERPISQADLLAEVTRRPRRADSAPRLDPEAMRRVAVHEAGHTVASLTGSTRGDELTFVTIVPRMDGSLGFVASIPRDGAVLTRRGMLEELEKVLAGRAAEEIIYGSAEVGLGAGGSSESSDLAVATSMVTSLVCQTGLGGHGGLHWTRVPTPTQEKQMDKLLRKCYRGIVARLEANRDLLEAVTGLLQERQEIGGIELRSLTAGMAPATSKPAKEKRA